MPAVPFDRIPFPSLQTYTTVSILLFSCSIYYAIQVTSDPGWTLNANEAINTNGAEEGTKESDAQKSLLETNSKERILWNKLELNDNLSILNKLSDILFVIIEEPLCVWTLINMVYCVMILLGKGIQKVVFGELRVIEQQHMVEKFWNFLFYKLIFVFGVMNVQFIDEVVMWCGWFSFVGAFHLLSTLCRDRFEYLSFSPTTPKWTHLRLFSLIFFILAVSVSLCTIVGLYANWNIFFFMAAEWALVIIRTFYVLVRYVIHLYDVTHEGIWEKRGVYTYYCELVSDLASLVVDFLHHLHMLLWRNIFLSVASLIICMQLRCFINDIQRKITRHKNYLRVSRHLESNFPLATKEEIEANSDDCAICWDRMENARKLPCGHLFHKSCLHSWLEQVTNCPTCRTSLVPKHNTQPDDNPLGQDGRQQAQTTNHFFHFDGSRYVSWLPSFSVEVSHTSLLGERPQLIPSRPSQLDNMVNQVLQMFPNMPYATVFEDLLITHSVEHTVENILEERLTAPPAPMFPPPSPSPTHRLNDSPFGGSPFLSMSMQRGVRIHPAPLAGRSPDALRLRGESSQRDTPSDPGPASSRPTEESSIVTGAEGCRFSKNSHEREGMLTSRKEELIRKARLKYVSRIGTRPGESD